jgi:hypothetical protein
LTCQVEIQLKLASVGGIQNAGKPEVSSDFVVLSGGSSGATYAKELGPQSKSRESAEPGRLSIRYGFRVAK